MKYRGCLVAAAVASVLAFSGCTWSNGVASFPKPTERETAANAELRLDSDWTDSGLSDRLSRPDVTVVHTIGGDEWAATMAECMNAAGFDSYAKSGEGLLSEVPPPDLRDADAYAMFVCKSQYPFSDSARGFYTQAQLEYLYDYYNRSLIPCLGWAGYVVTPIPSRESYLAGKYDRWSPYNSAVFNDVPQGAATEELQEQCAPMPEGFLD